MKFKNLSVFTLIVCLLLTCLPQTAFATESVVEEFEIPENAVYLSTAEDILALAENCISDAWSRDQVFVLKNDIDLSGTAFTSIPTFGGIFLGQGNTISGLRLSGEQNAQGFFHHFHIAQ